MEIFFRRFTVLFLFCMISFISCGNKNNTQNTEEIKEQISAMLKEAWEFEGLINADQIYCSPAYNNALREAEDLARKVGDIGPIDYEHWIQGQDTDGNVYIVVNDIEVIDSDNANADVSVYNFGEPHPLILKMVRIEDRWFIDDWIPDGNNKYSERKQFENYMLEMREYL